MKDSPNAADGAEQAADQLSERFATGVVAPFAHIHPITILAQRCHQAALDNGWWDARIKLMGIAKEAGLEKEMKALVMIACHGLICSEAGEAMDNIREGWAPDDKLPDVSGEEAETADIIIRALDRAGLAGWDIGATIERKLEVNRKRGVRHGGKLA